MFLGGWLSIICLHCQAYAAIDNSLLDRESNDHCDHQQSPQPPLDPQAKDSGCIGNCDHDNIDTLTANMVKPAAEKFSKSYAPDGFIYYRQNMPASFSRSLTPQRRHTVIAERACYLPLDRFCVQLK